MPMDGLTRYLIIDHIYSTLPEAENPDHNKFVQLFTIYLAGSDRDEVVIYRN